MTKTLAKKRGGMNGWLVAGTALCAGMAAGALLLGTVARAGPAAPAGAGYANAHGGSRPAWTRVDPDKAEIFKRPTPADPSDEIICLALNIYFEARGEPEEGKLAVAHVVMNRVTSSRFPGTICDVVRQGGELRRYRCQFTWWCDGRSDRPRNRREWEKIGGLALNVYWGQSEDPTDGALWYHADYVNPDWRKDFLRGPQIGRHIFYLQKPTHEQLASRFLSN